MSVYSNEINQMVNKILEKAVFNKNDEQNLLSRDITLLNFFLLKRISLKSKTILTDLTDETCLDYNVVRKEISDLENSGFIRKISDQADKRRKFIEVTQSGKNQIEKVNDLFEKRLSVVIDNFSVNEEKAVLKFLSRINQLTLTHSKK